MISDFLKQLGIEDKNGGAFNGKWLDVHGEEIVSYSPIDGEPISTVVSATQGEYEKIIQESQEAFRFLNEPADEESICWINAADPASLCGIRLDSFKGVLPSRIPSTHLVYRGDKPVLVSRRNGGVLNFHVPPDDLRIPGYLTFFKVLLAREFNPEKIIIVETINGKPALESDYARPLKEFGFIPGYKGLELEKKYS